MANEPKLEIVSECRSHIIDDDNCTNSEDVAKVKAIQEVKQNYETVKNQKVSEAISICNQSLTEVEEACHVGKFNQKQLEIDQLLNSISVENRREKQIYASSSDLKSESTINSFKQVVARLEKIQLKLSEKTNELEDLKGICEEKRNSSNQYCVRPVVEVEEVRPAEKVQGNAVAAARLSEKITLEVGPSISQGQDLVGQTQRKTTVLYRDATEVSNRILTTADSNYEQIDETIIALRNLFDNNEPEPCDSSGLFATCPTPDNDDESNDQELNPNPGPTPRPTPQPSVVAENDRSSDNTRSRENSESTQGLSAEEAMAEAQSRAYGSNSGADVTPTTAAAPRSQNGFGSILGSIGGLFGKTSGGFGSEGYKATNNSRMANNIQRNTGSSNNNYSNNQLNSNFQNKSNQRVNPTAPQPGGFKPSFSNSPNSNARSGSPSQGLNSSPSNATNKNGADNKPSLMDRLFGRKKDKTMFGKRDSSGRGGSFGQSSSTRQNRRGFNSQTSSTSTSDGSLKRVFDASKYSPSEEAKARAYARATGRRIASHSFPGKTIEWPTDISRNKKENIFRKVNLQHRINLVAQ